jgi:hypothetical protein
MQGGIKRNEWPVSRVFYGFFRSCGSFEDNTSWQHTFSSVPFLLRFIFKVHKFFSNCVPWSIHYPNRMHVLVCADLPGITSPEETPSLLFCLSLALHLRYIDFFQIIKLRTLKLTKCFFFKDGGPAFDLCPMWPKDVHSLSTLHAAALRRPRSLSLR